MEKAMRDYEANPVDLETVKMTGPQVLTLALLNY